MRGKQIYTFLATRYLHKRYHHIVFSHQLDVGYQLRKIQLGISSCFVFYKIKKASKHLDVPDLFFTFHNSCKNSGFANDIFQQRLQRNVCCIGNQLFNYCTRVFQTGMNSLVEQIPGGHICFFEQEPAYRSFLFRELQISHLNGQLRNFYWRYVEEIEMQYFKKHFIAAIGYIMLGSKITKQ